MTTIALTIGALELGVLISSVLYGIATVQAYLYTERSFNDPFWLRIMIFVVWVFETLHTASTWILLYSLTVTNYGRPSAIAATPWYSALGVLLTSSIGATVQAFFSWRVRVLGGRLIIPMISWSGAVVRFVFGVMLAVFTVRSKTVLYFLSHYNWLVDAQLSLGAAIDILNTSSLCYFLWRGRRFNERTRRTIDKLMVYTIETGLLTSLCAVAVLVCSLLMRDNFVYLSIYIIYPKLFSNSLFTSLNARQYLRRLATDEGIWNDFNVNTEVHDSTSLPLESGSKSLNNYSRRAAPPPSASKSSLSFNTRAGMEEETLS